MFESRWVFHVARQALEADELQPSYQEAWLGLKKNFSPDA
jgi:homogentisate 1,2-dioxygenase